MQGLKMQQMCNDCYTEFHNKRECELAEMIERVKAGIAEERTRQNEGAE